MLYGDFKDLRRKTTSDKILCDKALNIVKNLKCDGYPRVIISMVFNCFIKGR